MRLLGETAKPVELQGPPGSHDVHAADLVERAYERGYQRGLIAAGEPWVALFFALAGGLLGWLAHWVVHGG